MIVLVTGSRRWQDAAVIRDAIIGALSGSDPDENHMLVHGDCPTGADAIADYVADKLGLSVHTFPADWSRWGKLAGPMRNKRMVEYVASCRDNERVVVLGFLMPDSRGTVGTINLARQAKLPINLYTHPAGTVAGRLPKGALPKQFKDVDPMADLMQLVLPQAMIPAENPKGWIHGQIYAHCDEMGIELPKKYATVKRTLGDGVPVLIVTWQADTKDDT